MPDRRRWVDIWHAPSRGEALDRVQLRQDEYVVGAFAGDRKWCVLVARPLNDVEISARFRAFSVANPATVGSFLSVSTS